MKLRLKKGLKLNLKGALPAGQAAKKVAVSRIAVTPDDFPGFTPKVCVKEGDSVTAGAALMFDKNHPEIKLVSPVAGRVAGVVRGERRKVLRVEVEVTEGGVEQYAAPADGAAARDLLAQSGLLALIRQRPYDIVPLPDGKVRDIFVTALDTAPLAAPMESFDAIFSADDYKAGVALLKKITEGDVYLCHGSAWTHGDVPGAVMVEVEGPHPAGNAGVQAANIKPVDKGDVIWTLDLPTLGRIGRLASTGKPEWRTIVAVTGPEVARPTLEECLVGAPVKALLADAVDPATHHRRIVSGNVLSGNAVAEDEFLRYPYRQITVIAEGDDRDEFMGWASLSPNKMSESPSFPGHFLKRSFSPDARIFGGRRAMIMSGQYDKTIPMDILPEYLIKAILAGNIEDMEKLGIYEVAPEDFAAAEYVDTSKLPLQAIVRKGLDDLHKELD